MATYRALLSLKSSLDDPDSRLSALRLLNVFNRTFPPELSNLTNLRVLDLYNNNLTGVLPVSVATFHYLFLLSSLSLYHNARRRYIAGEANDHSTSMPFNDTNASTTPTPADGFDYGTTVASTLDGNCRLPKYLAKPRIRYNYPVEIALVSPSQAFKE
ncbi:hypothetical protein ACLB2K_029394 [Fragaria x ananassa]